MQVGDTQTWKRTFTEEDVRLFAQVSKDHGIHHMMPDEQGRIMVHGLLTATLPTKIGGDLNYIAQNIAFDFVRPVYVGDTVQCNVTITQLTHEDRRSKLSATFVCRNHEGSVVLMGHTTGIVRIPQPMNVGLH